MTTEYRSIFNKSLVLLIILLIIGLPINSLTSYSILIFSITVFLFNKIAKNLSLKFLLFILVIFPLCNFAIPSIKIHEGHNLVILNEKSENFYKENLPKEVYSFFYQKFSFYKERSQCDENIARCWKNYDPNIVRNNSNSTNKIYAYSSDWSFNKKYSRIVNNINFSNIISARIGAINNLPFNFFWSQKYDLPRSNLPFFIMYEIPKILVDSSLCWKGNLFWEKEDFTYINKFNKIYKCEKVLEKHINKKIYAASLGSSADIKKMKYLYGTNFIDNNDDLDNFLKENHLKLKLKKSLKLLFYEFLNLFVKVFFIFIIFFAFFKRNISPYIISFFSTIFFLILLIYTNENLLWGFDIYTGGNDGLLYSSYGNILFQYLNNLNFYEYFRGVEDVFYYPSSLRYFWPINNIFFGETIYGYLLFGYIIIFVIFFIFKNLFGYFWAIILTLLVFFTRVFEGYALSSYKFISHINAGDSEPLAIFFFLVSLLIFLKVVNFNQKNKILYLYSFLFGFFIFLSISLRPNYLPTGFLFLIIFSLFYYYYFKNIFLILALFFGFIFIFLIPFHNYFYGDSFTLLSSGYSHNTHVPINIYYYAFLDLLNLNWLNSEYINKILRHVAIWIKPSEYHYIITFFVLLISLVSKNSLSIKTLCMLSLSQHLVLLVFEPQGRYAYLAWILTIIIVFHFIIKMLQNFRFYFK